MQIKEDSLLKSIEIIDGLTEENINDFSEKHIVTQPDFMGYLMSSALEFNNEELLDYLVYYYNIFLEAASIEGLNIKIVDEALIDDFHNEYVDVLDEYSESEERELLETFCNQPALLYFLIDEINSVDEQGDVLSDETKSQLFIIGIALIGLLNRAING